MRSRTLIGGIVLGMTMVVLAPLPAAQAAPPLFVKVFTPDTIGPGSETTLTFTIDNSAEAKPADELAFSDTLPPGVVIATPANAGTTCGPDSGGAGPNLTAPAGGTTISLADASVGAGRTCTVTVDVTSTTLGTHLNTSGDLTSSLGNSGATEANLTVTAGLPAFSKDFSPDPIDKGERSTLTFLIDNTANGSPVPSLDFTDNLPAGLVIADPANASTTCGTTTLPATLTAEPGTSVVTLDADGTVTFPAVAAEGTCTVSVDVTPRVGGTLLNAVELLADFVSAGKATATLDVVVAALHISKSFTDDPIPPGGTATLEFVIENIDRDLPATGVAFTDTLPAGVVVATPNVTSNSCAGTLTAAAGSGTIALSGGTVSAQGSCRITVPVTAAAPGSYANTSGTVTGTVGGSPVSGNQATETLFVVAAPVLTKAFTDDPVAAGDAVTLQFTITDTTNAGGSSEIGFSDNLSAVLPGLAAGDVTVPPDGFCGPASVMAVTGFLFSDIGVVMSGGSLAMGASCTFDVTIAVPAGTASGTYLNTTSNVTATVGEETVAGNRARDSLVVIGGPSLAKEFTDGPVAPGGSVTLEFTLRHGLGAPGDATGIGFTDDLGSLGSGFTASGVPVNDLCGPGNGTLAGLTTLTASGITLSPGEECVFAVTVDVAANASLGLRTNTTSTVTATVGGVATVSPAATANLIVTPLKLTKEFTNDPVVPGGQVTLQFTFTNAGATDDATSIIFTDDLDDVVTGLKASAGQLPISGCGGTLSGAAGDTFLSFSGGSVPAGTSCSFGVTLDVPVGTIDNAYSNTTRNELATIGNTPGLAFGSATDKLVVESPLPPLLTKQFTDDPVRPGDPVTLQFTVENPNDVETLTGIGFTDDVNATLAGLTAAPPPVPDPPCGPNSSLTGTSVLALSGGELGPGQRCTFSVTLTVPRSAPPGSYRNTTSNPQGEVDGFGTVTGAPASDSLVVQQLKIVFTKSFTDDPVLPAAPVTLQFTIDSSASTADASGLAFQDNLANTLSGLVATGLPKSNVCGTGSQISGTSLLNFTGGDLPAGTSCTFSVTLAVPPSAVPGSYPNATSTLRAAGLPVAPAATDTLVVETPQADLSITKADDPDPVVAGDTLTYTVEVTNAGPSDATNVVVTDTLPAGVTLVSTSGCAEDPNGVPTCTLGTIPAGGSASYTITVAVDSSTLGVLTNTATVTSDVVDPNPENDSAATETTVIAEADLSVAKTDDPDPVVGGGALTYTVTVTNNGPSDASGVVATETLPPEVTFVSTSGCAEDPNGVPTCSLGDIAAGTSKQYTVQVTVDPDTPAGLITNTVEVTSATFDPVTSGEANNNVAVETTRVTVRAGRVAIQKSTNGVDADTAPGPIINVGDPVTWTYRVTNTGGSTLSGIVVTDDRGVAVSCPRTSLAPGASMTCTANGTAAVGQYRNVGTVTGRSPDNRVVTASDPSHYLGRRAAPAISIEKSTNGEDADQAPGPLIPVGRTVTWTYLVSNSGNVDLTGVTVVDDQGVTVFCGVDPPESGVGDDGQPFDLAVGESVVCTAVGTAVAGQYANLATATGTPPDGPEVTDDDPSHYVGTVRGAAVIIEKQTNGQDADEPPGALIPVGGAVSWSYIVTNAGDAPLTSVAVTDDRGVTVTCPKTTLGIAESMTCTAAGTAAAGIYRNVATVSAVASGNRSAVASDPSHYLGQVEGPAIDIEKSTNGADADTAPGPFIFTGGAVTWTYVVANHGSVPLTGVSVVDDRGETVFCGSADPAENGGADTGQPFDLAVGEAVTCTAIGTAAPGQYANTGTATGNPTAGPAVGATDPSHYLSARLQDTADVSVAKSGPSAVNAGTLLTYTVTVTNAGPATATGVTVTDTLPAGVTLVSTSGCAEDPTGVPTCSLGSIGPRLSKSYTIVVAVPSGAATGRITNSASVATSTIDPRPGDNSTSITTEITREADLMISKTASPNPVAAGSNLTYTVTVKNNGPSDAAGVEVTDVLPAGITLVSTSGCAEDPNGVPSCSLGTIVAGASKSFKITVAVPSGRRRSITNEVAVTSATPDPEGGDNSAAQTTRVVHRADLVVTKTDSPDPVDLGGLLTYRITVANRGPSNATGVRVTDVLPAGVTLVSTSGCAEDPGGVPTCTLGSIAAGASKTYRITVRVRGTTVRELTNRATVGATTPLVNTGDDTASARTRIRQPRQVEVGLFDRVTAVWTQLLRSGATRTFTYGNPGDIGIVGDWDGDDDRTAAVYRPSNNTLYARNSNSPGGADFTFTVGQTGDIPVSGDWNGNGRESLALFRPSQAKWFVYFDFADTVPDAVFVFGNPGDAPSSVDIDGDGDSDPVVHREMGALGGRVFVRRSPTTGIAEVTFTYGNPGDRILFGDYDYDGDRTVGIYRPSDATFYLRNSNTTGLASLTIPLGLGRELPHAGPF